MTKIEVPSSVTLYVQWILHPFPNPQIPHHKTANSKWTLTQTKTLLTANSIDPTCDVKLALQDNGLIRIVIDEPVKEFEEGKEFWETVFTLLKNSKDVESISVYVNNDTSDRIAANLADRVPQPWHNGYQGYNSITLIYHQ